jgi:hypothetical protein
MKQVNAELTDEEALCVISDLNGLLRACGAPYGGYPALSLTGASGFNKLFKALVGRDHEAYVRVFGKPKEEVAIWPPIKPGTSVLTIQANPEIDDWTQEALASRKWGVSGKVIMHHDSHGLFYDVCHEDGSVGHYDPSEIEVMSK